MNHSSANPNPLCLSLWTLVTSQLHCLYSLQRASDVFDVLSGSLPITHSFTHAPDEFHDSTEYTNTGSRAHTSTTHEACSSPIREDGRPAKAYMTDIEHMSMHYRRGGTNASGRSTPHGPLAVSAVRRLHRHSPGYVAVGQTDSKAVSVSILHNECVLVTSRVSLIPRPIQSNYLTSSGGWLEILSLLSPRHATCNIYNTTHTLRTIQHTRSSLV